MGELQLTGSLTAGPTLSSSNFPSSTYAAPLAFIATTKPSNVATGAIRRLLTDPATYVALTGVGATDTVTAADFLYLQSDAPVHLEITCGDGAGGTTVTERVVQGLLIVEFASTYELKGLRAKGAGSVQYLVSGQR